ncbi:MAG: TRAM domain-containing protein, partial [Oscillospiraceae bacterium]|nr:TRAM domain-containing protein [Oscillospiraceae bacterium]
MSTHIIAVTGYAADGSGVGRLPDGRVVFIPGSARGDICEAALT